MRPEVNLLRPIDVEHDFQITVVLNGDSDHDVTERKICNVDTNGSLLKILMVSVKYVKLKKRSVT